MRIIKAITLLVSLLSLVPMIAQAETTVQAEEGELHGGAKVVTAAGISYVDGLANDADGVTVTLTAPDDGMYDVILHCASYDGYKENYVDVDGQRVGTVSTEGKEWQDSVLKNIYLTQGVHQITIMKFWGWIKIDTVRIAPSVALPEDLYEVEPVLINPNATDNVKRLITYLCDNYGKAIISGQYCDDGMYGAENEVIYQTTGEYPAILGLDMIDYSPSRVSHGTHSTAVEKAIEYWENGGIVTFCWHWNAPEKYLSGVWYSAFYSEHTNIDLAAIMEGRDQEGYDLLMRDIDAIAAQLLRLQEAGVPVLWRPLHEAAGGWFWWGRSGKDAYLALYRLLYERLTNEYGLNNLIWVWNGQNQEWYPGDEYVDIIGEDIYPGERVYTSQAARFISAIQYTNVRKMIVLSENGCLIDPDLAQRDGILWGYTGVWSREFVVKNNRLNEQYNDCEMVKRFYCDKRVITRSEVPDLRTYPMRDK